MLRPGEKVVSTVVFRDDVYIFGDHGTLLWMRYNPYNNAVEFERVFDLGG